LGKENEKDFDENAGILGLRNPLSRFTLLFFGLAFRYEYEQ
jgi:hypothetical protein